MSAKSKLSITDVAKEYVKEYVKECAKVSNNGEPSPNTIVKEHIDRSPKRRKVSHSAEVAESAIYVEFGYCQPTGDTLVEYTFPTNKAATNCVHAIINLVKEGQPFHCLFHNIQFGLSQIFDVL